MVSYEGVFSIKQLDVARVPPDLTITHNFLRINLLVVQNFHLNPVHRNFEKHKEAAPGTRCYATHYLQQIGIKLPAFCAFILECRPLTGYATYVIF